MSFSAVRNGMTCLMPEVSVKRWAPSLASRPFHAPAFMTRGSTNIRVYCSSENSSVESTVAAPEEVRALVQDDLDVLIQVLPADFQCALREREDRDKLFEIVLDLGRVPYARFADEVEVLYPREITDDDLTNIASKLGEFGPDNRAGIEGTLHRVSAIRSRKNERIVGLTCRVGRAVQGPVDMVQDLLENQKSLLFLGRPGIGKTTVIRDIARTLADTFLKRVVIVDTSNEIAGDGDVPHPAIGRARRMQVPRERNQHDVMIEAVENHTPEVIIVDEIGTEEEALACRTIAERGVILVATAHGQTLENLMNNPLLSDLVGGLESVTLGDETARSRNCQKAILERRAPSTFPVVVEMKERNAWVEHSTEDSVDQLLLGDLPTVQVRRLQESTGQVFKTTTVYDDLVHEAGREDGAVTAPASGSPVSSVSLTTGSRDDHNALMSYDALADALNEQYSSSLPLSDFDRASEDFAGTAAAAERSSHDVESDADWLHGMDDISVLSTITSASMAANSPRGKSRGGMRGGRRGSGASSKRGSR